MEDLVFNPSNGQGSVGQAQDGSQVWLLKLWMVDRFCASNFTLVTVHLQFTRCREFDRR